MTVHNAPPVVYPLGHSRFQACLLAGLWCAGMGSVLLWMHSSGSADWRIGLGWLAVVSAGGLAFRSWTTTPSGQLVWDGQAWRWETPAYQAGISTQHLSVIADFQHLMLVRMEGESGLARSIWCERRAFPERWLDFRRAVFAPGRSDNGNDVAVSGHAKVAAVQLKP
ncbi:MAG: hypothetical protein V4614_05310 [Pseudomonadota bacterium]